jgi:hypothetical protein
MSREDGIGAQGIGKQPDWNDRFEMGKNGQAFVGEISERTGEKVCAVTGDRTTETGIGDMNAQEGTDGY